MDGLLFVALDEPRQNLEKVLAQAGADMINLSVGMLGSIMVASPEALAIDDEMCGAILRSVRGIEVREVRTEREGDYHTMLRVSVKTDAGERSVA